MCRKWLANTQWSGTGKDWQALAEAQARDTVAPVPGKITYILNTAREYTRKPARDLGNYKTSYVRW